MDEEPDPAWYAPWRADSPGAVDYIERVKRTDPDRAAAIERRWKQRDAQDRRLEAQKSIRESDELAMLDCRMRAPWVRGLTTVECGRLRTCFLCGGELPAKRQWWCSDACVNRWAQNHEWSAASFAALRRDRHRCRRCGSTRSPEVNHRIPRVGAGYHQGCHHHLRLIETLCHDCHVEITNAQAAARRTAG